MTRDELLANLRRMHAWEAWKDGDPWPEQTRTADRAATLEEAIRAIEATDSAHAAHGTLTGADIR